MSVTLPSNYQGAVCGLCGNYNGNAQDDLTMPNGQTASDGAKLGESWQVALAPGCSSVCRGEQCQDCSDSQRQEFEAQIYCGIIADKAGPFRDCHSHVDPAPYLEDCVYDACHYKGHHASVCDAVGVYTSACQSKGIIIQPWRRDQFCRKFLSIFLSYFKSLVSRYLFHVLPCSSLILQQWCAQLTAIIPCVPRVALPPAPA